MLSTCAKFEVNELTRHSASGPSFYLGLLAACGAVPVLGLSIFAGHVADRFSRKAVLILTQIVLSIMPALFALLAYRGIHNVWVIYAIILVNGIALTFARPSRGALIVTLVPRQHFGNAVTWNSSIFEISGAIAPALAGVLIAGTQLATALYVSATCMFACLIISLWLPNPKAANQGERMSVKSLLAGVRFVFRTRLLLAAMSLDLFAVLFGGVTYLIPVFADRLGVGAAGQGGMSTIMSLGAISMALLQTARPPFRRAGRALLIAIIGFGLATIVFGLSTSYWLSLAMLFVVGMCDNVSVVVRHSLVNLITPDSMRGRVGAVNQVFIGASNEIGGLESGMVAAAFGPVASAVIGGFLTIATCIAIASRFREIRLLGQLHEIKPAPADDLPDLQNSRGFEVGTKLDDPAP
jgi:MFS family permease